MALIKKDLALAIEAANTVNADTNLTQIAIDYYGQLEKKGYGNKDFGFVYQYIMKNRQM